jgi:hypothetical protein
VPQHQILACSVNVVEMVRKRSGTASKSAPEIGVMPGRPEIGVMLPIIDLTHVHRKGVF